MSEKIMIASDIHGSAFWCEKLLEAYRKEAPSTLVLLGDLLYHGPRNPLPDGYAPQTVASLLNGVKENLLCVRGNCDSEVDQMLLEFPMLADYAMFKTAGKTLFLTHGHLFNSENCPALPNGAAILNGHFHVPAHKTANGGAAYINCGSVSLPKDGTPHSYLLFKDGTFVWKDLATDGEFDRFTL